MYTTIEFIIDILYILAQSCLILGMSYLLLKTIRYFISSRFKEYPATDYEFNEDDSTDTFEG